ncbi:peptidase S41-like protein [Mucilaginibacter frigoritolerans]|uniref:Peptidase S41-like protein n=1 Tax=Mucilaginibacter frigoritolerans TaxID=652788 RepID=A0A562UAD4_9SPHI|nr:S41 family peptidase [Mucilaginibacter frigoritolerans]TWJ02225.1 peptidase S41-like protein [Mucilaginibacter frigoritolerans]
MKHFKIFFSLSLFCSLSGSLFAQAPAPPITAAIRLAVTDSLSASLLSTYVYKDTALKMSAYIHKRLKDGAYKGITNPAEFAQALNADVHYIYNDKHLAIQFDPRFENMLKDTSHNGDVERQRHDEQLAARQNYGFKKVEILNGNIGYVYFDRFFSVDTNSKSTVDAVFAVLKNVDALIFDLRQNGGGDPAMVQYICNYLFKDRTHLNDLYERRTNKTDQFWTTPAIYSSTFSSLPVYVLVSGRTFSGGEEFSYDLQSLNRVIIVGETTGGGAHPVRPIAISNGFIGNIPYARAVNPVTKKNWEAVGVKPDVQIAADSALDEATLLYFNYQIDHSKDQDKIKSLTWARDMLTGHMHAYRTDTARIKLYTGNYAGRIITLKNGSLYYTKQGIIKTKLIALSADTFKLEGMENIKLQFNKSEAGNATELVISTDDGFLGNYKRQ